MQFVETYKCLSSQLNYCRHDMTYAQWKRKPCSLQACYLFVNFFPEVNRAWRKAQFSYVDEAEAVSIALQYLNKNVQKIIQQPNRYKPAYIYQVCFNCIRSLHWKKCDIERFNTETSSTFEQNGVEFSVFDKIADTSSLVADACLDYGCDSIEQVVHSMGVEYENVAYNLFNCKVPLRKVPKSNKNYSSNPFSDISITQEQADKLTAELKDVLTNYILDSRPDLSEYVR